MPRKNAQDRLEIVWDETLDGDYGGLSNPSADFDIVGRAFKFTANGVQVSDDEDEFAGVFVRDTGQRGILPEDVTDDIRHRYLDGNEVSVMLKGQITYALAGAEISADNYVIPTDDGSWQPEEAYAGGRGGVGALEGANRLRVRGPKAKARTAASAGEKFVLILF